ncbi:hypothetical protein MUK42_08692 [Musa troglodytarum]|uniref:Calcium-transporting P-type ATPase N-terminal autoinhibitory domain-containing protein n=1 Tax=Musa troglodytarum TaxID=320322 RepID=A0A9E7LCI9_9LILI|nr:hypothetical protein MUK42_08692 [Musa troglodytarum]
MDPRSPERYARQRDEECCLADAAAPAVVDEGEITCEDDAFDIPAKNAPVERLHRWRALGHSPKRSGEARRGPSASLHFQAVHFKEVSPGRLLEPRHQTFRASTRVKSGDRTSV